MWLLSPEQVVRLAGLQRRRDLQAIGDSLGGAFPEARTRLGERWNEVVEHGVSRAATYGLVHMLCAARFLASWIACGAGFETRQPWAVGILTDAKRSQGAKAYQLCVGVLEQLRSSAQPGQPTASDFAHALRQLDGHLADAGTLASLLPRERIRLGEACDVDAVELRLVDSAWRQHYTAQGGPWRREACAPEVDSVSLAHDPLAEDVPSLPEQVTLLTGSPSGGALARLRVRVNAGHRCDPRLHPLLECVQPAGVRSLRGDAASDATLAVYAEAADDGSAAHIGEEDSPRFELLTIGSCGVRARGMPIGGLSTLLAAYGARQHLIAWRREPAPAWELPGGAPPPVAAPRCRREVDGEVVDSSAWVRGFQDLDARLQQGVARLLTAWERESGVTQGKLAIETALLVGTAGITWGWAEGPRGIAAPPYMRLESLFELVACRLGLRFSGILALEGAHSEVELSTDGSASLSGAWQRGFDEAALFSAAAGLQVAVHQAFEFRARPLAHADLAVLGACGPLRGAISGAVGLEQRPDGPGLRWFVRLRVDAVVAQISIRDPLLGVQYVQQPLLPPQVLVEWSQA